MALTDKFQAKIGEELAAVEREDAERWLRGDFTLEEIDRVIDAMKRQEAASLASGCKADETVQMPLSMIQCLRSMVKDQEQG